MATAARAEVAGRGAAVVRVGGGYATDLFLGAGYDPTATVGLGPSAVLDLSLSPRVKLFTEGELDAERYFETHGDAYLGYAEALLQFRPWLRVYPELFGSAQGSRYVDLFGPADPANPTLPSVSRSTAVTGGMALRGYPGKAEVRLLLLAGERISAGAARYVEYPLTVQVSGASPLGARVRVGGYYRFTDNESDTEGFFFHGHTLSAFVLWRPVDRLTLRVTGGFRHNWNYDTWERANLPRGAASVAVRLVGRVYLELAGSAEGLHSLAPDGLATLYSGYGGLRVEGGPWRF